MQTSNKQPSVGLRRLNSETLSGESFSRGQLETSTMRNRFLPPKWLCHSTATRLHGLLTIWVNSELWMSCLFVVRGVSPGCRLFGTASMDVCDLGLALYGLLFLADPTRFFLILIRDIYIAPYSARWLL